MDKSVQDIKLLTKIEDIGLPENIVSDLRRHGNINTLKNLIEADVVDLLKIYGIGEKKVDIIISTLNDLELSIPDSRKPKAPPKTSVNRTDFPFNLLAYISENKSSFNYPENVTQDTIDGIHFVCLSLSDKQQAILYLRFECQQTLEKIGTRFSLSATQIGNIINTSISTWFKTDDIKYIEYGMKGYVNHLIINKAKCLAESLILEEYNRGYKDGYNEAKGIQTESKNTNDIITVPIENLNLSLHAYNCIKRAKIDTVADLISKTEEDMMKVRNLGRKYFEEVRETLHQMGLSFREEEVDYISQKLLQQVTFSAVDGLLCHKNETSVYVDNNRKIFAQKSTNDGYEYKYCTYEIPPKVWGNFVEEAVIIKDITNWKQEDFELYDDDNYIHNDVRYSVEFVLNDKTLKFSGGTSSNGVRLIKDLFDKYFEPPCDIQYNTELIENVF